MDAQHTDQSERFLLGEYIERARAHGIESLEEAGERAWMYQMAMRGIAEARHRDRLAALPANPVEWNREWQPGPEQQAELREELRLVARRAAIMENFEAFVRGARDGSVDSGLLPYQIEPFEATQQFVSAATNDLLTHEEPVIQLLTKGGYLEEPPSFGKTYFMAAIARAAGAGKPPNEHDNYPIRVLVLTPRRKLVRQTIGMPTTTTQVERGFAAAAPDLRVTPYYSGKHDLTGDVVVMTYQSFIGAVRNGLLDEHHFDIILCDEGHRLHAPKTKEAFTQYRPGRLSLALSGSPDYDDGKRLQDILPVRIDGSDPLTGIHEGYINGFQYWAYQTSSRIVVNNSSQAEFTDAELHPLINDAERNGLILSIMKRDIESGRRGIVRCVRGGECLHPRLIASLAEQTLIRDPLTGEMRPMRVIALDYKQDDILDEIIDLLSQPEGPDALTYVGILNEGVDSAAIRFIVDAAPTTSQVVGKQVAGRSYRLDPEGRLTMLSQLFDEVVGRKTRYTFLHAVGVHEFEQGLVVAQPALAEATKAGHRDRGITQDELPIELRGALVEDLQSYCTEFLELQPIYGEVLPDSISLISLVELGRSYVSTLGRETVQVMLRRVNFDPPFYAKPEAGMPGYYYKETAWDVLEKELQKIKLPPEGWMHRTAMVLELGSNTYRFDRFIRRHGYTGLRYNHPQNLVEYTYYNPKIFEAFKAEEDKRLMPDPGDIEVLKLAREVGASPATLERFLAQRNIKWQEKQAASKYLARFINAEQAAEVRDYFGVIDGSLTITEISNVLGLARTRVNTWMQGKGYIEPDKQERAGAPRLTNYGRRFPPDIITEAIEALNPDEANPDWVTLRAYAAENGRSYSEAKRIIDANNIPIQRVRDAKTRSAYPVIYLDAEGRARYDEVAPPVGNAEPGDRTMNQLKEMTGFSDFKIRSAMSPDELASGVPKIAASGPTIGRKAPHFPAKTVADLLTKFGIPIPSDVARAAGLIPGSKPVAVQSMPASEVAAQPKNVTPSKERRPAEAKPVDSPRPWQPVTGTTIMEASYEHDDWVPVGQFLQEIQCDTKSFWVLLRRLSLASQNSFRRPDGSRDVLMRPYVAAQVRRQASHIETAPRGWYSSEEIARHCKVGEQQVIEFIRQLTPQDQEVKLFRSAHDSVITTHYGSRIAGQAKRKFGVQ
ncbi:MAG TPA: DEAD/DEAH box helicase family protein [Candidatus Saccharimonadales bacterium]|nr:DEAD/DEAH box helicase family protein [Candidatus Saccharimonadales bacterium]